MGKDTGIVNIRGKEYATVAKRVQDFRDKHHDKYGIVTSIERIDDKVVVMSATIMDEQARVIATGHAEENRAASPLNKTSALENCETSAIGRALAAFGFAGSEFASADEVAQAISKQQPPQASAPARTAPAGLKYVTEPQLKLLIKMAKEASALEDKESVVGWFVDNIGSTPNKVLMEDMTDVMDQIQLLKSERGAQEAA